MINDIPKRYENADFDALPEVLKKSYPMLRERKGKGFIFLVGLGQEKHLLLMPSIKSGKKID